MPNHDERAALATNCPRENGATIAGNQRNVQAQFACMEDFNKRVFATEHDKKMFLHTDSMGLVGVGSENTSLHIKMIDDELIHMQSHKEFTIGNSAKPNIMLDLISKEVY